MIYASRGIGKTYVSLSIALATASGIFGEKWKAEKMRRVLFVDGEMPQVVLHDRIAALVNGNSDGRLEMKREDVNNFRIITPDHQELGVPIPDLSTIEGQKELEKHLNDIDVLILDNISSLCRSGNENEAESWLVMQDWLLTLRRRGIAVILIHHAGKSGNQRGTSRKEDLLDTVVSLKRPSDYDPKDGARFEVHYEKARGFFGKEAIPFEACLRENNKGVFWEVQEIEG